MNAELLLEHFHRIGDAPDAVPRLRRFILDLAVRGKLVPQDPRDEPASTLLKRINKEKVRDGRRQQQPLADAPLATEIAPLNWQQVPLIALGSWAIGAGFPKGEQGLDDGPYLFLKVSDMNLPGNEKYIVTANNFIDEAASSRMRAKIHPPGTIIFPKIGGAIATNKRRILTKGAAIDNNCLGITFSREIDIEWAYLLLTSLDFAKYQAGTAVPALQQGVLEQVPVSLPPLAEQHRIVAKVDELMALCDRLEAARTEREAKRDRLTAASLARLNAPDPDPDTFADHARFALDNLPAITTRRDQVKQLRQTILNLAVRGKLVPQDPNEEPASALLKRIEVGKARRVKAGTIRRQNEFEPLRSADYPFDLPDKWMWVRLGSTGFTQTGTTPSSNNPDYFGDYIPFVKPADLTGNSIDYRGEGISKLGIEHSRLIEKSSVLMVCIGSSIGKVNTTDRDICCNQQINTLTPHLDGLTHFVSIALRATFFQALVRATAGMGTLPIISKGKWEVLPIPLPPLAEQHRIVAKVDELMALCDRLETSIGNGDDTRNRLLSALLHDALSEPALSGRCTVSSQMEAM